MATKIGEEFSTKSLELMEMMNEYSVGVFGAVPGFVVSGKGSTLVDVDGREIIDFACTMSAGNFGHCHPVMAKAVKDSIDTVTLTNIATYHESWPQLAKKLCQKFGYQKVATMVSGAEAADSVCKIARKWGITRKGISPAEVLVLGSSENYHGLTTGIWPLMDASNQAAEFGVTSKNITNRNPKTGEVLRYGHIEDYEAVFREMHGRISAVIIECLHGRLPTIEQENNFAIKLRQLCREYNVLFIADEIRMGCAKTGKFLSCDWMGEENKPDMITLGKSITGGMYPASYILGNNDTMELVGPYSVSSTFAKSPTANIATLTALQIYEDEKLLERAAAIGRRFTEVTSQWKHDHVEYATCRGADACVMIKEGNGTVTPRRIARLAFQRGVLVYPMGRRLRISIALNIEDEELNRGLTVLGQVLDEIPFYGEIPGDQHEADSV
ncbi:unnamed protein product [Penicillium bialowiezense]